MGRDRGREDVMQGSGMRDLQGGGRMRRVGGGVLADLLPTMVAAVLA